jgi:nucleoside-diphosphate-sugar epimerase
MKSGSNAIGRFPVKRSDFSGSVLVTGAGGCIGSWLMALLVNAGIKVVAYDLSEDKRRPELLMSQDELDKVTWVPGDVVDTRAVFDVATKYDVEAIIHQAALQVPFCKANPALGAKVNVVGTINVLEAARNANLKRVAYASSVGAVSFEPGSKYLETLYGAYKVCNEMTARIYMQDWGVPSIGIRPGIVYGVARDQGISSKTTTAILAAAASRPYTVPFSGAVSALHAGEVASAFIRAVSTDRDEAKVFDLNGSVTSVEEMLDILREISPGANLAISGGELPFEAAMSDEPIQKYLGDYGQVPLKEGIQETYEAFQSLLAQGLLSADSVE